MPSKPYILGRGEGAPEGEAQIMMMGGTHHTGKPKAWSAEQRNGNGKCFSVGVRMRHRSKRRKRAGEEVPLRCTHTVWPTLWKEHGGGPHVDVPFYLIFGWFLGWPSFFCAERNQRKYERTVV